MYYSAIYYTLLYEFSLVLYFLCNWVDCYFNSISIIFGCTSIFTTSKVGRSRRWSSVLTAQISTQFVVHVRSPILALTSHAKLVTELFSFCAENWKYALQFVACTRTVRNGCASIYTPVDGLWPKGLVFIEKKIYGYSKNFFCLNFQNFVYSEFFSRCNGSMLHLADLKWYHVLGNFTQNFSSSYGTCSPKMHIWSINMKKLWENHIFPFQKPFES